MAAPRYRGPVSRHHGRGLQQEGKSPPGWWRVWRCGNAGDADARLCWPQLAGACVLLRPGLQICASAGPSCLCFLSLSLPSPNLFLVSTHALAVAERGGSWTEPILLHPPSTALPSSQSWLMRGQAGPALPCPGHGNTPASTARLPSGPWQPCCWVRMGGLVPGAGPCAQPSVVVLGGGVWPCCHGCSPRDQLSGPGSACGSHRVAPGPVLRETP